MTTMQQTNVSNNGAQAPQQEVQPKLPFVIKDRTLVERRVTTVDTSPMKLPDVKDYLARLQDVQKPLDYTQSLDSLRVFFDNKVMAGRLAQHNGLSQEKLLFSANGASQVARLVLPSRFFSGLRQLALMDRQGEALARDVWKKFSSVPHIKEKDRMIRTIRMRVEGDVYRVVRSCHSTGYAPYSNLEFVQAILENAGDYSSLPVLDWRVTDSAMRLRFAGLDDALEILRHWDAGALADEPIPMIECWNSEVGRRKVGLRGGLFKLDSGGAIPHWDERREWFWIHRGNSERIQNGVKAAFTDLITAAQAVVGAYNSSKGVDIDDVFAWLVSQMKQARTSERVIGKAKESLDKAIPVGRAGKLSQAIDAITLAALEEKDIFEQYKVERIASNLMKRGLDTAKTDEQGNRNIPAKS